MTGKGPLFGAPAAENDRLLAACTVDDQVRRYLNPIIFGRWGTGKSAILLSRARSLENILNDVDPLAAREWYIREQDLEPESLFALQRSFGENRGLFDGTLQRVWKSEIIRRVIFIIDKLGVYYEDKGFRNSNHWKLISNCAIKENAEDSFWKSLESVVKVIFPSDDRSAAIKEFAEFFNQLGQKKITNAIQRCIIDLEEKKLVTPIIGVEPLETPASDIDRDVQMSLSVIAALLNCFRNDFVKSPHQRITVLISIPWNRINNDQISFPQHISPYTSELRWNKSDLRTFICKRIEYEAKVRANMTMPVRPNRDAWDLIFSQNVRNNNYSDRKLSIEKSFDYVCRHTLWRARDLQTIAREAVELQCQKSGKIRSRDFFRRKMVVDEDSIREAVATQAKVNAELRLEEARRRYNFDFDLYASLYGMKVPFDEEDLKERIAPDSDHKEWAVTLQVLWESGIIGYAVDIMTEGALRSFRSRFGEDSFRIVKISGAIARGYLFQYNASGSTQAHSISTMFSGKGKEFGTHMIIHPTFNEFLDLHVDGGAPIGC